MIPLSLYIHIPWCVKKCPYCDFNSHQISNELPEQTYIDTLIKDLEQDLPLIWGRSVQTIFIGGGTPSLFSAQSFDYLLTQLHARLNFAPHIEITMEANPGTVEQQRFKDFVAAGINRLSLGIQSFQDEKLRTLGRIHDAMGAQKAIDTAINAGFSNFNIDLMFGLPQQTISDALFDLTMAIKNKPTHLSWYQLTIEPHTQFFQKPPPLPSDDLTWDMQQHGQQFLSEHNYQQYEVSAYAQSQFQCQHNRNYWEFGDYLGIGAGAHSKITDRKTAQIQRRWKIKHPKHYLAAQNFIAGEKTISKKELAFEFMLNALRLYETIPVQLFEERTGLQLTDITEKLQHLESLELLHWDNNSFTTTTRGKHYLNEILNTFL